MMSIWKKLDDVYKIKFSFGNIETCEMDLSSMQEKEGDFGEKT